jgi:mono/diheme cytochrome c family protein
MAISLSFRRTMAATGLLAAGISSLACLLPVTAWAGSDSSWKNGEEVYAKVCGYCHRTGIGPVIKGRELPPEYTVRIVRHGLRAMPAFPASFIDDQALQEVAGYILKSAAERK